MAQKKYYPGGFRLTKKKAVALAVQELGMARGLEAEPGMPEGYFHMVFGSMEVQIQPDTGGDCRTSSRLIRMVVNMSGSPQRIVQFFDVDTLEPDFRKEDFYLRVKKHDMLEDWVTTNGPEVCHKKIDQILEKEWGGGIGTEGVKP